MYPILKFSHIDRKDFQLIIPFANLGYGYLVEI